MEDLNFRKGDAKTDVFGSDRMLQPSPVEKKILFTTDALFWLLLLRKMLQASSLRKLLQNTAIETVAIQELLKSVPVVVTPLKWQLSSSFNSF